MTSTGTLLRHASPGRFVDLLADHSISLGSTLAVRSVGVSASRHRCRLSTCDKAPRRLAARVVLWSSRRMCGDVMRRRLKATCCARCPQGGDNTVRDHPVLQGFDRATPMLRPSRIEAFPPGRPGTTAFRHAIRNRSSTSTATSRRAKPSPAGERQQVEPVSTAGARREAVSGRQIAAADRVSLVRSRYLRRRAVPTRRRDSRGPCASRERRGGPARRLAGSPIT